MIRIIKKSTGPKTDIKKKDSSIFYALLFHSAGFFVAVNLQVWSKCLSRCKHIQSQNDFLLNTRVIHRFR